MRIAVLRLALGGFGGAETALRYLLRGLLQAGHQLLVFSGDPGPPAAWGLGAPLTFVTVPVFGGKTLRLLGFAVQCRRLLKQASVDVVFSLERTLCPQVYRAGDGCHREWLARRRAVLSPLRRLGQTLSPFHQVVLWLEKRLFAGRGLERIIVNSRQVRKELQVHYRVPEDRIRIIYNGLDRRRFRPPSAAARRELRRRLGLAGDELVVLFVGSGFARKGLARVLQACAGVSGLKPQVWVVGKGAPGPYQALSSRLGLSGRVRFWGPQREVAPFYQAADLLALPTLYDPCSNVVLEALACGLPCLTTDGNGAAEFLTPGVNGAVLPGQAPVAAWVEALQEWLGRSRDPAVAQAAQAAVAPLDWSRTVNETLQVLEEAAAARSGGL